MSTIAEDRSPGQVLGRVLAHHRDTRTPPSAIRPYTQGSRETRTGHGQENARPRTAGAGAVTLTVHPVPQPCYPFGGGRTDDTTRLTTAPHVRLVPRRPVHLGLPTRPGNRRRNPLIRRGA